MKPIRFHRPKKRLGSRSHRIGRIRWKLWELLVAAGLSIPAPDCFWMQEGGYRHRTWDLARWGADWEAVPDGSETGRPMVHSIHCWDTMTKCVKCGIVVAKGDGWLQWEIHAKE